MPALEMRAIETSAGRFTLGCITLGRFTPILFTLQIFYSLGYLLRGCYTQGVFSHKVQLLQGMCTFRSFSSSDYLPQEFFTFGLFTTEYSTIEKKKRVSTGIRTLDPQGPACQQDVPNPIPQVLDYKNGQKTYK